MKTLTITLALAALLVVASPAMAVKTWTLTIASSGTTSDAADTRSRSNELYMILFPATFTGATVTFHCSQTSGGTYAEIVDGDGTAVSVTATDGKWVSLSSIAGTIAACRYIKVVSASSEAAERTLVLMSK